MLTFSADVKAGERNNPLRYIGGVATAHKQQAMHILNVRLISLPVKDGVFLQKK